MAKLYKTAEPIEVLLFGRLNVVPRNSALDGAAYWRHLANTLDRSLRPPVATIFYQTSVLGGLCCVSLCNIVQLLMQLQPDASPVLFCAIDVKTFKRFLKIPVTFSTFLFIF